MILEHEPQGEGEIELQVGDIVILLQKHWNGYSQGRNQHTNKIGIYPEYKTQEKHTFFNFTAWNCLLAKQNLK